MKETAIVLFSDDFRIKDNPALYNACEDYDNIILLYVYNDNYLGRKLGSAAKVFLHYVLKSFNNLLNKKYNVSLLIKTGDTLEVVKKISKEIEIHAIYFNHSYTKKQIEDEEKIKKQFKGLIDVKSFKSKVLFEPKEIVCTSLYGYYRVFTPFSKECIKRSYIISDTLEEPLRIKSFHNLQGLKIEDLNLIPKNEGDWHLELIKNWSFDYDEIETNFINFASNKLEGYNVDRNLPYKDGNSKISPYLRFGILGIKWCFNVVKNTASSIENQFILELLWREFAYHTTFHNQNISTEEIKPEYKKFQWNKNEFLEIWQKGETGFDIVDAGMKELWQTGFMHNRLRMIVASFLTKDLFIDWKLGEEWFWNTLVDADPAVNAFSWQWVFGSGLDSMPYFRIFNPDSQQERFDPTGSYCRKWLKNRPKIQRIVDHAVQRKIAMERYRVVNS